MKGFILAAGFGKRMGELTRAKPKPLLPVNGVALIVYTLFQMHRWKTTECWINTHFLADQMEEALRAFPYFPLHFSFEPHILGTAGALRKPLAEYADEPALLVMNPDAIFVPAAVDDPTADREYFSNHPGCDAFLFLGPRAPGSQERGWNRSPDGSLAFSEAGVRVYLGCSLIRPASVGMLSPDTFAELGPIWVDASRHHGRLIGRDFLGLHVDVGSAESYTRARAQPIYSGSVQEEWENFIRPLGTLPGHRLLFPPA